MIENKRLKRDLVLQSFAPLFLILCVKHAHCYWIYLEPLLAKIKEKDWKVFFNVIHHAVFGELIVFLISFIWIIWATLVYFGFVGIFTNKFDYRGEGVCITNDKCDSGATFLVSFVLPLMVDDVCTLRGFIIFALLLLIMIKLLINSNLFYQNPVLTVLGYKVFEFQFTDPYKDITNPEKTYIGITKGKMIEEQATIKRKYIADNVFIIFNE